MFVRKNALQILIPKYGLEGTLYLENENSTVKFAYDEENQTQTCGEITFYSFDPVTVRLSLNSTNIQHEKGIKGIKGFSLEVEKMEVEADGDTEDKSAKKRKMEKKDKSKKQKK